jgi:excisionase family DNA binding protein
MSPVYLTVKELAQRLNIKDTTLYAWAAQGKIPSVKFHGVLRFPLEEIERWVASFQREHSAPRSRTRTRQSPTDLETVIARAKGQGYTSPHGETRPASSSNGKEEEDGAR